MLSNDPSRRADRRPTPNEARLARELRAAGDRDRLRSALRMYVFTIAVRELRRPTR